MMPIMTSTEKKLLTGYVGVLVHFDTATNPCTGLCIPVLLTRH
jgi:hypothetical protein